MIDGLLGRSCQPDRSRVVLAEKMQEMKALLSRKKLREARFFLDHLERAAAPLTTKREHFEFLLSAFLSAARSVPDIMPSDDRARYKRLFPKRNKRERFERYGLDPKDTKLLKDMNERRIAVVHNKGVVLTIE